MTLKSFQETIRSNYTTLNEQFKTFKDQELFTNRTLQCFRPKEQNFYNNVRPINIPADADRKQKFNIETKLTPETEDRKNKISILSHFVRDETINIGEIEVQQIESTRNAFHICFQKSNLLSMLS